MIGISQLYHLLQFYLAKKIGFAHAGIGLPTPGRSSNPPPTEGPNQMPKHSSSARLSIHSQVATRSLSAPLPMLSETGSCDLNLNIEDEECIPISSFADLKKRIQDAYNGEILVFCPFRAYKPPEEKIMISSRVVMACSIPHQCRINGPNTHIKVGGDAAQIYAQGFIFEGAGSTESDKRNAAIKFLSGTQKPQLLCECIFRWNKGTSRGVGLFMNKRTDVSVIRCRFEQNESTDIGAGIFTRGNLLIVESVFLGNESTAGSAITCANIATLKLRNNVFEVNKGRGPILLRRDDAVDLGGNVAVGNNFCNGIVILGEENRCESFLVVDPVDNSQSNTTMAPLGYGGRAYFNYNQSDSTYGPSAWGNVRNNSEHLRYKEMQETLQLSLENECERNDSMQSPIDLCKNIINSDCKGRHQTRTRPGNVVFGEQVTAQILPSKLRLKYYPDRTPEGSPLPPQTDFSFQWPGLIPVNHIDIKIPSEHTICGHRFPAEYTVYSLHPGKRKTIVMSILMKVHPYGKDNKHFQKLIDQWQKEYNKNAQRCGGHAEGGVPQELNETRALTGIMDNNLVQAIPSSKNGNVTNATAAYRNDEIPDVQKGWDPFHPSLERSIYHWGYWGSLTEPPCSDFVAWRVLTKPAYISQRQLNQLRNILFTHRDDDCNYTSVADPHGGVARPIQDFNNRDLHRCTSLDYISD